MSEHSTFLTNCFIYNVFFQDKQEEEARHQLAKGEQERLTQQQEASMRQQHIAKQLDYLKSQQQRIDLELADAESKVQSLASGLTAQGLSSPALNPVPVSKNQLHVLYLTEQLQFLTSHCWNLIVEVLSFPKVVLD